MVLVRDRKGKIVRVITRQELTLLITELSDAITLIDEKFQILVEALNFLHGEQKGKIVVEERENE